MTAKEREQVRRLDEDIGGARMMVSMIENARVAVPWEVRNEACRHILAHVKTLEAERREIVERKVKKTR